MYRASAKQKTKRERERRCVIEGREWVPYIVTAQINPKRLYPTTGTKIW
jgi:adenylate kinase family enzyme